MSTPTTGGQAQPGRPGPVQGPRERWHFPPSEPYAGRTAADPACPLTAEAPNHAPGVFVGCICPGGYNPPAEEASR